MRFNQATKNHFKKDQQQEDQSKNYYCKTCNNKIDYFIVIDTYGDTEAKKIDFNTKKCTKHILYEQSNLQFYGCPICKTLYFPGNKWVYQE